MHRPSAITDELNRTKPDFVVYVPKSDNGATYDTGNEHFLVFDGPDGSLMAVWTQSTFEGLDNQRLVFSKSRDEGLTWSDPVTIAGPKPGKSGNIASWGFPMVSKSGRIYVIYNKHIGVNDLFTHTTGIMSGIYSDDCGQTWSKPQVVPMRRSIYDNPNPQIPANWIVWQKPERYSNGKYFTGFTRWVAKDVRNKPPISSWIAEESVAEFMRFENIDSNPEPAQIQISNFAFDKDAIRVGFPGHPIVSVVQEPSIVDLPDGRLFCVMRTSTGSPYWIESKDAGQTWTQPKTLKYNDVSEPLLHPLSPCPIYKLIDGRFLFLFHNNDGHFEQWGPTDTLQHRRPVYVAIGEFKSKSDQPIHFSAPLLLMDNDGIFIGHGQGRCDLAMYSSFTRRNNENVLWYPERKFFLLGRRINGDFLS